MTEPVFTARLFKNDKNNLLAILIYILLGLMVGLLITMVATDNTTVQWVCGGALLVILALVVFSKKLTFNEPGDKNIYISREGIAIGTDKYDWDVMKKVGIYVDAFYGFRYSANARTTPLSSSYGMDNWIYFRAGDKKHSYRFLIPNHDMYFLLEDILAGWHADGRRFVWKEAFGRKFVEQQMAHRHYRV